MGKGQIVKSRMFFLTGLALALSVSSPSERHDPCKYLKNVSRRKACASAIALALPAAALPALATDPVQDDLTIYVGAGCFWHVQHEMALHEALVLERRSADITAVSGYAGGTTLGDKGRVCYHNKQGPLCTDGEGRHLDIFRRSFAKYDSCERWAATAKAIASEQVVMVRTECRSNKR